MAILSVNPRAQVTLPRPVRRHLGVKPVDLLPDGRAQLRPLRSTGTIEDIIGLLAGETEKIATLEEMEEAAARGWAGQP